MIEFFVFFCYRYIALGLNIAVVNLASACKENLGMHLKKCIIIGKHLQNQDG